MSENFYLTTTLPYVNDIPHIGHTLEFIQADVIVRFMRSKLGKENVLFNVGTDEHGLKILTKAQENSMTPQEYSDKFAAKWQDFCKLFSISYNTFYRTSADYHTKPAQKFWKASEKAGDIYKKKYEGLYCVGCEEFKTEKELVDGKCPLHDRVPILISEENYFFRLSKYRNHLLKWLDENPDVLKPEKSLEELRNWISNMEDISVSRVKEKLPWGIEVPGDPTQVMYVWFDALTNYVNIVGYGTDESEFKKWWPVVQCFGPDNLRFQGAIFQGMLASAGLPQTRKLLRHGMILAADGTKMSKTKGNVVSPFDQNEKYGAEAVRFYMIAGISTYGDSAYKESDLINLYNAHLANNYGNLLNRTLHLITKKQIKNEKHRAPWVLKIKNEFVDKVDSYKEQVLQSYENFELQEAAQKIIELCSFGNEYITEKQPWSKDCSEEQAEEVLLNLVYLLKIASELYLPIIPESAAKALKMIENCEVGVLFNKLETGE